MDLQIIIQEFIRVIKCQTCQNSFILRDQSENIPQPGYIGKNYQQYRILLVGQNPGICPPSMKSRDSVYMKALIELGENPTFLNYEKLYQILQDFIPDWPVNRNYFPLEECGLGLEDIAYCNVVRCRTDKNKTPSQKITENCINEHLFKFVEAIDPQVIIFIGKWAYLQTNTLLKDRPSKMVFLNRDRSLSATERSANKQAVIEVVQSVGLIKKPYKRF